MSFVHRTFQEYLAGKAAVESDDIGVLLSNAVQSEWRETIVMAVGHAKPAQRAELISGLLGNGEKRKMQRESLHLLAVSCLETAPELAPTIRQQIESAAAKLLPPKTKTAARALSAGGSSVLDLLDEFPGRSPEEITAIISTVSEIGDPAGIGLLERYAGDSRKSVQVALFNAWSSFDASEYARRIIIRLPKESLYSMEFSDLKSAVAAVSSIPELKHLDVGKSNLWQEPTLLKSLFASPTPRMITAKAAGPSISWSLVVSGAARLAIDWSTDKKDPLLTGAFLDAVAGDLRQHGRGVTQAFTAFPTVDWQVWEDSMSKIGSSPVLPIGICLNRADEVGAYLATDPVSAKYFAAFDSPGLVSADFLRHWGKSLDAVAFIRCPGVDLTALGDLGCSSLMIDANSDLRPIKRMKNLNRLFLFGEGEPDLGILKGLPCLRNVYIEGFNKVASEKLGFHVGPVKWMGSGSGFPFKYPVIP